MKVRISAPQLEPETIAKLRFAKTTFGGLSFQATMEEMIQTGLEVNNINRGWDRLTPEEKKEYCKGLDLKY